MNNRSKCRVGNTRRACYFAVMKLLSWF